MGARDQLTAEITPTGQASAASRKGLALLRLDTVPPGASLVSVATQRAARLLRGRLAEVLAGAGTLSLVDWRICLCLARDEEQTQKALVDFSGMEQGQVSRALARMEDRGLLTARQSAEDRRVRLFALTQKGRAWFEALRPVVSAYGARIDAALTPDEQHQFLDMLGRITAAASQAGQPLENEKERAG